MKKLSLLVLALSAVFVLNAQTPKYPYQDVNRPRAERVDDLLSRLTLEEKVGLLMNGSAPVERLGIPKYNWWNEALHGVGRAGLATVFPQAIGMAAMFDVEEHRAAFDLISDEARAKYHQSLRENNPRQYYGLTYWTPNINIFRDPRWGRGQETYGEDPYLTSVLGVAAVKGLQGEDPNYYKTHACAKHYAVHSGLESERHSFDVSVSDKDLWETYLPAFRALVKEGNVQEVMGAYNRVFGEPACASDRLLVDILRDKWQFGGLVVSDCGAIDDFYKKGHHETHPDAATASADAVLTGTDIECGSSYKSLVEAVQRGLITEKDLDVSVRRALKGMFDLGMFDPDEMVPWTDTPISIVDSKEHREQALNVARKSIVLLKNDNVLPVKPSEVKKIAVLGPNADDSTMMLGNYNGTPSHMVTILDGIKAAYPGVEVTYERGCDLVEGFVHRPMNRRAMMQRRQILAWEGVPQEEIQAAQQQRPDSVSLEDMQRMMAEAMKRMEEEMEKDPTVPKPIPSEEYTPEKLAALANRAAEADVIVFVGGISPALEGEELHLQKPLDGFIGGDRTTIELPEIQSRVLAALHKTGKPVVFILCSGSSLGLANDEGNYDALLCAWYGGQAGGTAVGDVLSGKFNPQGRLPLTFYKSTDQLPDVRDYDMTNRTYRYFTGEPLYPFGYGLSYSEFEYGKAKLSAKSIKAGQSVSVKVPVTNVSKVNGTETVQIYVKRLNDPEAPIKSLKGLAKVDLKAGETKTVEVVLPASSFEFYNEAVDNLSVKKGDYQIFYGSSSADADLAALSLKVK